MIVFYEPDEGDDLKDLGGRLSPRGQQPRQNGRSLIYEAAGCLNRGLLSQSPCQAAALLPGRHDGSSANLGPLIHRNPKDALPPHSIGGMVRTQATMASTSPSVILLK